MFETCSESEPQATLELTDEIEENFWMQDFIWMIFSKTFDGVDHDQSENVVWLAKKYQCSAMLIGIELTIYREASLRG
jgi:hypothetical protein